MNNQYPTNAAPWPLAEWTSAPLQLDKAAIIAAPPEAVFTSLSDPAEMCRVFSWMHTITLDNSDAMEPNGLGAKRRCHFGNGMVLEEVIVGWEPPFRYAYRGVDETHPFGMIGHLGIIECRPFNAETNLIWKHYFDHSNPAAMRKQLNESVDMALQCLRSLY